MIVVARWNRVLLLLMALALAAVDSTSAQTVPRFEIGPMVGVTYFPNGFRFGASTGARIAFNFNEYFAGEADAVWQNTGRDNVVTGERYETVAQFDLKVTHRMWEDRPLGINAFAVVGPGLLNRRVSIPHPNPPPFSIRPTIQVRETVATFNFGGGIALVPSDWLAIRFDLVGVLYPQETFPYSFASSEAGTRVMLKIASMFRFAGKREPGGSPRAWAYNRDVR